MNNEKAAIIIIIRRSVILQKLLKCPEDKLPSEYVLSFLHLLFILSMGDILHLNRRKTK